MYRFVINPRYIRLFVALEKATLTVRELSKKTQTHYAHLTTVIGQFRREGIISTENVKNTLEVTLTEKGKALAVHLFKINDIVLNWKDPVEKKPTEPKSELVPDKKTGTIDELTAALNNNEGETNGETDHTDTDRSEEERARRA